jgi:hypothetical protein
MPLPDKIERLKEDASYPSFWSAEYGNQVIDILNALRKLEVKGGKITWSDAKVVIEVSGSTTPTTPTSSSISIESGSNVYCLCRYQ